MVNTKLWLTALVGVVFVGGGLGLGIWNESRPETSSDILVAASSSEDGYTMAQIAEHGDATSCWSAIEGKVYDLTEFIEEHPGGPKAVLVICGSEGTGSFNSMPTVVMPVARMTLAKYQIGVLAE
ncbi:MAG: cytochrome b5-like heme/steroid binding domain-containing protein [Patescibacteria group bacterium]